MTWSEGSIISSQRRVFARTTGCGNTWQSRRCWAMAASRQGFEARSAARNDVDTFANQIVTKFDLDQVALELLAPVLDRVEQLRIHAGEPGNHPCVGLVALAIVGVDGTKLAWIGDDHLVTKFREETA